MLQSRNRADSGIDGLAPSAGSRLARQIDYRSGGVIAVSRIVLAATFFLALWFDPSQPHHSENKL